MLELDLAINEAPLPVEEREMTGPSVVGGGVGNGRIQTDAGLLSPSPPGPSLTAATLNWYCVFGTSGWTTKL